MIFSVHHLIFCYSKAVLHRKRKMITPYIPKHLKVDKHSHSAMKIFKMVNPLEKACLK